MIEKDNVIKLPETPAMETARKLGDDIKKIDKSRIPPTEQRNTSILKHWIPIWTQNTYYNFNLINKVDSFEQLIYRNNAIVVGMGASLDENYDRLRNISKYNKDTIIMCSNSALRGMIANGIRPHYVIAFDSGDHIYKQFEGIDTSKLSLITHTAINPRVIQTWRGRKYFFNIFHPGTHTFEYVVNGLIYPEFTGLPNSGCVANTMTRIAILMGMKKIYLCGVDYGFVDGKYRAKSYKVGEKGFEEIILSDEEIEKLINKKLLKEKNGIKCWEEHISYNKTLVFISGLKKMDGKLDVTPFEIIDCSKGIINEFKKGSLDELVVKGRRNDQ